MHLRKPDPIVSSEGLLACTVKAIAYPLLGDHVVREANHYIRLLNSIHWSYS
ncbi:DUF2935 domain-containing protein [Desulforamulus ferrireducens]|uniref:DUF2935 domain-containing protein n=1 Tax=Desulforamulus ferrireducens TaxID=1833852 RepID=UPI003B75CE4C